MNQQIGSIVFGAPPLRPAADPFGLHPRLAELAVQGEPPLTPRHERALAPGVVHVFCTRVDCPQALRKPDYPQYVGALGPGTWGQCRKCGTWYDGDEVSA